MTDPGQALELKFIGSKTVSLLRKGTPHFICLVTRVSHTESRRHPTEIKRRAEGV